MDVVVIFFSSIIVLTPNRNFWIVPQLHSVSDIFPYLAVHPTPRYEIIYTQVQDSNTCMYFFHRTKMWYWFFETTN
jgi:hypothetical protein